MDYQKPINAFIQVLKNQRQLFSATDSEELVEIANNLPATDEAIWEIISPWLEARTAIKNAVANNYIPGEHLGPGGSGSQKPSAETAKEPALRDNLKNEIILHQSLKIYSFAVILLLHLIKQSAENRTTRSWDISIRNSVRDIKRLNSNGFYLNPTQVEETLQEAYDEAIDRASLEAFEGIYEADQLQTMVNSEKIIASALALLIIPEN